MTKKNVERRSANTEQTKEAVTSWILTIDNGCSVQSTKSTSQLKKPTSQLDKRVMSQGNRYAKAQVKLCSNRRVEDSHQLGRVTVGIQNAENDNTR